MYQTVIPTAGEVPAVTRLSNAETVPGPRGDSLLTGRFHVPDVARAVMPVRGVPFVAPLANCTVTALDAPLVMRKPRTTICLPVTAATTELSPAVAELCSPT